MHIAMTMTQEVATMHSAVMQYRTFNMFNVVLHLWVHYISYVHPVSIANITQDEPGCDIFKADMLNVHINETSQDNFLYSFFEKHT